MKIFYLISLLFFTNFMFSQVSIRQKSRDYYNLNGNVRRLEINQSNGIEVHEFDSAGFEVFVKSPSSFDDLLFINKSYTIDYTEDRIEVCIYNYVDKMTWKGLYYFDEKGKVIKETWSNLIIGQSLSSEFLYNNGVLVSEIIHRPSFDDFEKTEMYTLQYYYNDKGLLCKTEKKDFKQEERIVSDIKYRNNGVLFEKIVYVDLLTSKKEYKEIYKVEYDKRGNEKNRYIITGLSASPKIESKIKFNKRSNIKILKLFDKKGEVSIIKNKYFKDRLAESKFRLADGNINYKLVKSYDKYGNVINSSMKYYLNPELSMEVEYLYNYDSVGNWVRKTIKTDGQLTSIINRKIIYY